MRIDYGAPGNDIAKIASCRGDFTSFERSTAAVARPQAKDDPWQQDLDVLVSQLPKQHLDAFHWVPREQFEQHAAQLRDQLKVLDERDKPIKFAELVASLHDGHSFVEGYFPFLGFAPETYPIRLHAFADGIFVQSAARSHVRLLGARLVAINGQPVDEVFTRVSKLFPAENAMAEKAWTVYGLTAPDVLHAYGILDASRKARFQFELRGKRVDVDFTATERAEPHESFGQVNDPDWVNGNAGGTLPLRYRHLDQAYWYEFDAQSGTLFVQFNQVGDTGDAGCTRLLQRGRRSGCAVARVAIRAGPALEPGR